MNKPSPADLVIAAVDADSNVHQLRAKLDAFEAKLQGVQIEIADTSKVLHAQTQERAPISSLSDVQLAALDLDAIVRPVKTIETLREQIRQLRNQEAELSEGLRIVRRMLRQREDACHYAAFKAHLVPEQLDFGSRGVDRMLDLAELYVQERELREPLRAVGRFDASDIWAVHPISSHQIRDMIERLERHGYKAAAEQRRRYEALERAER